MGLRISPAVSGSVGNNMDLGSALGGAASGLVGGALSMIGANAQNEANFQSGADQRTFEAQMSDTAHQRDVADLKAAGLNPILSANAGSSTPTVGAPQMQNALGAGVSSGLDAAKLSNDLRSTDSQITLQSAQALGAAAGAARDTATAKFSGVNTQALQSTLDAIAAKAKTDVLQSGITNKYMNYDNIQKRIGGALGTLNSAKDLINPFNFGNKTPFNKTTDTINPGTGEILQQRNETFERGD